MKKSLYGKIFSLLIAIIMIMASFTVTATAEEPDVKVSKETYNVSITSGASFVSNTKAINPKVGNKVYMIYTVESVDEVPVQQGVAGCADSYQQYPYYDGGLLYYGGEDTLLKVGYTYFIEFVVTDKGFDYTIARAKGNDAEYVTVSVVIGDATADMKHFGLWLDGAAKAKLKDVRMYNAKGEDLGVTGKNAAAMRAYTSPFPSATDVPHTYTYSVKEKATVIIGNKIKNKTDKMYMEYTVASSDSDISMTGFHLNGYSFGNNTQFIYDAKEYAYPCELLVPGATYWIEFSNTHSSGGWDALIQRTVKGKTEWFKLTISIGEPSTDNNGFCGIYFGDGANMISTFELKNVKVYDANRKNLGLQSNVISDIVHYGELESYEDCEILYYSETTNTFVATYSDKTIKITKDGATKEGTYSVDDAEKSVLEAKIGSETVKYTFSRTCLIDEDGNRYEALGEYEVSFVTGTDTKIPTQTLSSKNGYKVKKPENPTLSGDEFVCWVTSDGKEYNFDSVQVKSMTLYAKWKNKAGVTYTVIDEGDEKAKTDLTPFIAIGASILLAVITAVGIIFVLRRLKKS